MKTNITISIDHELVHKLREEGEISRTINRLVRSHVFGGDSKESMKIALKEKKKELDGIKSHIKLLEAKLKEKPKLKVREV